MASVQNGAQNHLIRIIWHGPFKVDDVRSGNNEYANKFGLYQIYGDHIVSGHGTLLYIGRTGSKDEVRTFKTRLEEHYKLWLNYINETSVYLGIISDEDWLPDSDSKNGVTETLKIAETFSIWWHSPPYNSHHLNDFYLGDLTGVHIQNWKNPGRLSLEYSWPWKTPLGLMPKSQNKVTEID